MPPISPAGFVASCQPSPVRAPPAGAEWLHEVKHDGFRLMVQRADARVRLFTRNGHDWAERYPAIVMAAAALQARSFLIDGEAVVADARASPRSTYCGVALATGKHSSGPSTCSSSAAWICVPCRSSSARSG